MPRSCCRRFEVARTLGQENWEGPRLSPPPVSCQANKGAQGVQALATCEGIVGAAIRDGTHSRSLLPLMTAITVPSTVPEW